MEGGNMCSVQAQEAWQLFLPERREGCELLCPSLVVAAGAAVKAHVPGLQDALPPEADVGDGRRDQSNRDKRATKKRRLASDLEELRTDRQNGGKGQQGSSGGKDAGGKGKGKTKDQLGPPICSSWASSFGPCGELAPGAECVSAIKRVRRCRKCLSPSHQDAACTKWGGGKTVVSLWSRFEVVLVNSGMGTKIPSPLPRE